MPGEKLRNLLRKLRIKQQQFQEKHTTATLKGVLDLDLPLEFGPKGDLSLRQILLSCKCPSNCTYPLFASIDYNPYNDEITALYHKGNQTEVLRVLSALPVVLAAQYGAKVWDWFSPELKADLCNVTWDPVKQCLDETFDDEDDLLSNIYGTDTLADWEEVDSLDAPEESTASVQIDLALLFNEAPRALCEGYDDNKSMATMNTGTSNATRLAETLPLDPSGDDEVDVLGDDAVEVPGDGGLDAAGATARDPEDSALAPLCSVEVPEDADGTTVDSSLTGNGEVAPPQGALGQRAQVNGDNG